MQLYCKRCDTTKDADEFIKRKAKEPHSQKNARCCKECNRKRNKERYDENPEVRARAAKCTKSWMQSNPERVKAAHDKYSSKNMPKRRAKDTVKRAIRDGRLIRGVCSVCGTSENVHGHHDSYEPEDWLKVRWLCALHHKQWHMTLDPLKIELKKKIDLTFDIFVNEKRDLPRVPK